jgi:hypothetical protein
VFVVLPGQRTRLAGNDSHGDSNGFRRQEGKGAQPVVTPLPRSVTGSSGP